MKKTLRVSLGGVEMDVAIQHVWVDSRGERWAVFSVDRQPYLAMEKDA